MPESFDKPTITRLISTLARKDCRRRLFGSAGHDCKLNPPIPVSTIDEFEARHGIRLPEDYRYFITEIGNGGAGPAYGLFPFGQQDDGLSWKEGGLIGDVSQPFPHVEAWNLPESFFEQEPDVPPDIPIEEEQRLWEQWDKVEQEHYWNPSIMNGAIPICHIGCALRQWLVVNGNQKGLVWNDYRADQRGIFPVCDESGNRMTFSEWYLSWLTNSMRDADLNMTVVDLLRRGCHEKATELYMEATGSDPTQADRAVRSIAMRYGMARSSSRRHELLVLAALIVMGVLLALLLALWRG